MLDAAIKNIPAGLWSPQDVEEELNQSVDLNKM